MRITHSKEPTPNRSDALAIDFHIAIICVGDWDHFHSKFLLMQPLIEFIKKTQQKYFFPSVFLILMFVQGPVLYATMAEAVEDSYFQLGARTLRDL